MIFTHNGILLGPKNKGNAATYWNMDESWWHHVKWNEPHMKIKICSLIWKGVKIIETNSGMVNGGGKAELFNEQIVVQIF